MLHNPLLSSCREPQSPAILSWDAVTLTSGDWSGDLSITASIIFIYHSIYLIFYWLIPNEQRIRSESDVSHQKCYQKPLHTSGATVLREVPQRFFPKNISLKNSPSVHLTSCTHTAEGGPSKEDGLEDGFSFMINLFEILDFLLTLLVDVSENLKWNSLHSDDKEGFVMNVVRD